MFKNFTRRDFLWTGLFGIFQFSILKLLIETDWPLESTARHKIEFVDASEMPVKIVPKKNELSVALSSNISPGENLNIFGDMFKTLGKNLGIEVKIVQKTGYRLTNQLLDTGTVQMAFIGSGAVSEHSIAELQNSALTPIISGNSTYRSFIVVATNSPHSSIGDLRGKTFAYTDPMSFSGCIAPKKMIKDLGYNHRNFFDNEIYTYSHKKSLKAVEHGIIDGAAVESWMYELIMAREPELARKIKIIDQSLAVGNPPLIISKKVNQPLKDTIINGLLNLHFTEEGQQAMKLSMIDKFVPFEPELYQDIWSLASEVSRE